MRAYDRLMYGLLGGGDPEEEKRLTEQQRRAAMSQGIGNLGAQLLASSGPSRMPVSLGQALGQGLQAGRQGYQDGAQQQLQSAHAQAQAEQQAQWLASLPPEMQQLARVMGPEAFAKQQAKQQGDVQVARERERAQAEFRAPTTSSYAKAATDMGLRPGSPEHAAMVRQLATQSKAPQVTVNQGPQYSPFDRAMAGKDADALDTWRTQALVADQTLESLNVLRQINSLQQGGKVGEATAVIGQFFGTDAAANAQTFKTVQGQMVLKQAESLSGAMSDGDIALLRETLPQYGNDPRSNAVVLDILERAARRAQENYAGADAFANERGGLRGYRPIVRQSPLGDVRIGEPGGGSAVSLDGLSADEIEAELRKRRGK